MKHQLKVMVRGAYDLQKLRTQTGNRIAANFRSKLGLAPSDSEAELEKDGQKILKNLRARYSRITDGLVNLPSSRSFKGDEVISSYTELCLVAQYMEWDKIEKQHFRRMGNVLKDFPIYIEFLEGIKGVGPAMAGVIISEIDIEKARYPSSLWKYAGLDVGHDGRGRSRRKEHLVKVAYKDKDGKDTERNSITFNPFLKTKLVGVLAASFLRSGSEYRDYYDNYKHRLETDPGRGDWTKSRRHNAALRYMIKMFLIDLYKAWRALEGLPVAPPYSEAKLNMKPHRAAA